MFIGKHSSIIPRRLGSLNSRQRKQGERWFYGFPFAAITNIGRFPNERHSAHLNKQQRHGPRRQPSICRREPCPHSRRSGPNLPQSAVWSATAHPTGSSEQAEFRSSPSSAQKTRPPIRGQERRRGAVSAGTSCPTNQAGRGSLPREIPAGSNGPTSPPEPAPDRGRTAPCPRSSPGSAPRRSPP